jgi:hypothetical protein
VNPRVVEQLNGTVISQAYVDMLPSLLFDLESRKTDSWVDRNEAVVEMEGEMILMSFHAVHNMMGEQVQFINERI